MPEAQPNRFAFLAKFQPTAEERAAGVVTKSDLQDEARQAWRRELLGLPGPIDVWIVEALERPYVPGVVLEADESLCVLHMQHKTVCRIRRSRIISR